MNEKSGTMTSSPGPMPSARRAKAKASVPFPHPTTWPPRFMVSASSVSKASTWAPRMKADAFTTSSMARSSSGRSRACSPPKSTKWMAGKSGEVEGVEAS